MSARTTPATEALRRAGIAHVVHAYRPPRRPGRDRERRPDYGREAAAALGVATERVFKTLIAVVDGAHLTVALVPVSRTLDPKGLARSVGGRRAELVDPASAERATGYVVGGISPLGLRRPLPAVVDVTALDHATVYVSAGRRGLQLELAPDDLVGALDARLADIAASQESRGTKIEKTY